MTSSCDVLIMTGTVVAAENVYIWQLCLQILIHETVEDIAVISYV